MATVTSLSNYSFAFNGFIFGGANSVYQVLSVDGLQSIPLLRTQDSDRGYLDGAFSGRDFYSARTITINILTQSGNGLSAQQNFLLLQAALQPQQNGTSPLQFQISSSSALQVVNARVRNSMTTLNNQFTYGFITSQYTFFAPNPFYFDNTVQTGTMFPSALLGRTYNRVYPLTFGGGSLTGSLNVTNNGTVATYPTVTINGPITNPSLGSTTANAALNISYTMAQSDVISIDLYNRTILLNGNPARNILLGSSSWFNAGVGSNYFYISGETGSTTLGITQASVSWQNAYI